MRSRHPVCVSVQNNPNEFYLRDSTSTSFAQFIDSCQCDLALVVEWSLHIISERYMLLRNAHKGLGVDPAVSRIHNTLKSNSDGFCSSRCFDRPCLSFFFFLRARCFYAMSEQEGRNDAIEMTTGCVQSTYLDACNSVIVRHRVAGEHLTPMRRAVHGAIQHYFITGLDAYRFEMCARCTLFTVPASVGFSNWVLREEVGTLDEGTSVA